MAAKRDATSGVALRQKENSQVVLVIVPVVVQIATSLARWRVIQVPYRCRYLAPRPSSARPASNRPYPRLIERPLPGRRVGRTWPDGRRACSWTEGVRRSGRSAERSASTQGCGTINVPVEAG